ncbi:MAG: class I adenylate-forming enzyme family protein [Xanthomonadales bacterium]|nr:class I adenylate-forming enzyme family protein [Xanthomonadales bacterium]
MSEITIDERVRALRTTSPDAPAFIEGDRTLTWSDYDRQASALAAVLVEIGIQPGDRIAVFLPDGPEVHVAFLAAERAGIVVVGIGPRAGDRELEHLLSHTGATALITGEHHRGEASSDVVDRLRGGGVAIDRHLALRPEDDELVVSVDGLPMDPPQDVASRIAGRAIGPDDLFLLNSTSGTTGLPKCVMQHQRRWWHFHEIAAAGGELSDQDRFMSVIPAPFGFGLWTAHFTPTYLGAPTVLMERFDASEALRAIEASRVSVLCCVSTQFIMLLNHPDVDQYDLSSLRVMYTGGEAVPFERAAEFERETGGKVLQFYGSNETGALSCTTLADNRRDRLRSAGRVIPEMNVRLLAEDGTDVTATGGPGQPACKGPVMCHGYYGDDAANQELFTDDGWMLMGDIATIDKEGYLEVVGRVSDIIIRGGKNISAVQVEEEVGTHPSVALAAAVGMPDPVFGERVCVFVTLRPGSTLDLDELLAHLRARGVGKELFPERLEVVDEIETSSGGKLAKGALRRDIADRVERERDRAAG